MNLLPLRSYIRTNVLHANPTFRLLCTGTGMCERVYSCISKRRPRSSALRASGGFSGSLSISLSASLLAFLHGSIARFLSQYHHAHIRVPSALELDLPLQPFAPKNCERKRQLRLFCFHFRVLTFGIRANLEKEDGTRARESEIIISRYSIRYKQP